jgi:hypothetical protein
MRLLRNFSKKKEITKIINYFIVAILKKHVALELSE